MSIEKPTNLNPKPKEENEMTDENQAEKLEIKNTADFQAAIERGELEEAERFLDEVKNNREAFSNYDDRCIDHRERELFKAYYGREDWAGAKRIVEGSIKPDSKEGRKKRLEELSGMRSVD